MVSNLFIESIVLTERWSYNLIKHLNHVEICEIKKL